MTQYPAPAYHFLVEWGGTRIGFLEVSGLNILANVTESRSGASPMQTATKAPGQLIYSNIILKREIEKSDNDFFDWINTIRLNKVERRDIVISLLNEVHEPIIRWKVRNAFPVRLSGPVLNANSSDVAIEELEIAHEGFEIEVS